MRQLKWLLLSSAGVALLLTGIANADSQFKIGEWHIDFARSKFGRTPPRDDVRIYEIAPDGKLRSTHRVTRPDGVISVTTYAAFDDGKPYPLHDGEGNPAGTITLTSTGPSRQEYVTVRDGKVQARGITTVSKDGNTLTMEQTNGEGEKATHDTLVWSRQKK